MFFILLQQHVNYHLNNVTNSLYKFDVFRALNYKQQQQLVMLKENDLFKFILGTFVKDTESVSISSSVLGYRGLMIGT